LPPSGPLIDNGGRQRGPDQERATEPSIAEICLVEPRIAKSGPTQIRLAEVGSGEHGGIGAEHR
jgi:hypothetical protein